jgi:hypothetical protein
MPMCCGSDGLRAVDPMIEFPRFDGDQEKVKLSNSEATWEQESLIRLSLNKKRSH